MNTTKLKNLLKIDSIELLEAVKEYGAEDIENPTKKEIIHTSFDIFFDRAFNNMLLNGLITDSQRDSIILNLFNEFDFNSIDD